MYELWFRAVYGPDLADRKFSSAVRPGTRMPGQDKGVNVGETVKIRLIDRPGHEAKHVLPTFHSFECLAKITRLEVKKLSELQKEDLASCSEDSKNPKTIKYHLGLIYNRPFDDNETITLLSWEYL